MQTIISFTAYMYHKYVCVTKLAIVCGETKSINSNLFELFPVWSLCSTKDEKSNLFPTPSQQQNAIDDTVNAHKLQFYGLWPSNINIWSVNKPIQQ